MNQSTSFDDKAPLKFEKEPTLPLFEYQVDKSTPAFDKGLLEPQKELSHNNMDFNRSSIAERSHYSIEQVLEAQDFEN